MIEKLRPLLQGDYFFKPLPMQPVRIMRIACGAAMFLHYFMIAPELVDLFTPGLLGSDAFLGVHFSLPASVMYVLLGVLLTSAASVIFGFQLLWTLPILFLCQSLAVFANPAAFWGWGFMIRHFIFIVWLSEMFKKDGFVPAWIWRIMQIQVCLIYFVSQLNRLGDPDWQSGEMVLKTLLDGDLTRFPQVDWVKYSSILTLATYLSSGLEWLASTLIFLGPLQMPVALLLIAMHLSLQVLVRVQFWQPLMIAALLFFMPQSLFGAEKPADRFRRHIFIPVAIAIYFFFALIHAWPSRLLSESMQEAQEWLRLPVAMTTLTATQGMSMIDHAGREGRRCLFALGMKDDGELHTLMRDQPSWCRVNSTRWQWSGEITQSLWRTGRFPQGYRKRIMSNYFCKKFPGNNKIFVARVLENSKEVWVLTHYECRTQKFLRGWPNGLLPHLAKEKIWIE